MSASELPTIVYEPGDRAGKGFFETIAIMIRNMINSWDLIWQLFRRDFFMRFKRSFIGMGWIFITPLLGIVSWVFFNATGVLKPGDVGIPYPAYVLLSSSIYGLWGAFQSAAAGTLKSGTGFINQVNYPHEALLVKQLLLKLVDFGLAFFLNIIVLLLFGVTPSWMTILFPVLILPLIFLGSSIGLMVSIIEVVTPDLNKAINFLLGLLMYITPVIYSPKVEHPVLQTLVQWNPLTYLIGGARDAVVYGRIDHFGIYIGLFVLTFIMFCVSLRIFYVAELKVIERMI